MSHDYFGVVSLNRLVKRKSTFYSALLNTIPARIQDDFCHKGFGTNLATFQGSTLGKILVLLFFQIDSSWNCIQQCTATYAIFSSNKIENKSSESNEKQITLNSKNDASFGRNTDRKHSFPLIFKNYHFSLITSRANGFLNFFKNLANISRK